MPSWCLRQPRDPFEKIQINLFPGGCNMHRLWTPIFCFSLGGSGSQCGMLELADARTRWRATTEKFPARSLATPRTRASAAPSTARARCVRSCMHGRAKPSQTVEKDGRDDELMQNASKSAEFGATRERPPIGDQISKLVPGESWPRRSERLWRGQSSKKGRTGVLP